MVVDGVATVVVVIIGSRSHGIKQLYSKREIVTVIGIVVRENVLHGGEYASHGGGMIVGSRGGGHDVAVKIVLSAVVVDGNGRQQWRSITYDLRVLLCRVSRPMLISSDWRSRSLALLCA